MLTKIQEKILEDEVDAQQEEIETLKIQVRRLELWIKMINTKFKLQISEVP